MRRRAAVVFPVPRFETGRMHEQIDCTASGQSAVQSAGVVCLLMADDDGFGFAQIHIQSVSVSAESLPSARVEKELVPVGLD
jgi:hypothetical protein